MTEKEILDHHIGFATAELKAKFNNERKYIIELLRDAIDAFEIDRPDVAHRRIKTSIEYLKKDIK